MFTELRLKNFKSWEDTGAIRMAPITAFFGANSSGKSSILQALLLLKQTAESSDRNSVLQFGTPETLVDLGNFKSVVFEHNSGKVISYEISWEDKTDFIVTDLSDLNKVVISDRKLKFSTEISSENGDGNPSRIYVKECKYSLGQNHFGMQRKDGGVREYELDVDSNTFELLTTPNRELILPPPIKFHSFPDQVRVSYQNVAFLFDLELKFVQKLNQLFYVGPFREYPRRSYEYSDGTPDSLGQYGENFIGALIASRESREKYKSDEGVEYHLEEYVAYWLKRIGLIEEFQVKELGSNSQIYQVHVKKNANSPEALITDVGFGVSQILPVLVLCFYAPEGATLILEQPELHLHPSVQEALADVLIDAVKKRKVQIILESHSEHLPRRLQRRMAEETLASEQAALYFCRNENENSTLTALETDELGNIKNWPEDFFGDQFGELAQTQRARIKRMKASSQ